MQANKDMNVENSREVQNFLRNEAANKEQLKIMEERMQSVEMKVGVDVQSQLEAY